MTATKNIRDYPDDPWVHLILYTHRKLAFRSMGYSISNYIKNESKATSSLRYWVNTKSVYRLLRATISLGLTDGHFFSQMIITQQNQVIEIALCVSQCRGDMLEVADRLGVPLSTIRYRCGTRQKMRWVMWKISEISKDRSLLIEASRLC